MTPQQDRNRLIVAAAAQGEKGMAIAKRLGVHPSTVFRVAKNKFPRGADRGNIKGLSGFVY